jgi:alcohol dehydrogenase YqhD (iron-dependent ADH family)
MLAGAFSHNGLTAMGRQEGSRGGEHALEHQLSGYYDTAHGAGLSVMMPALLKYIIKHGDADHVAKVAQLGVEVFGVQGDFQDIAATAYLTVNSLTAWLHSIGMPTTLTELGIPTDELEEAIQRVVGDTKGKIAGFLVLDADAISEIYHIALGA